MTPEVRTDRLVLRGWRDEDGAPYAAVNADPLVMAWIGPLMTRRQSDDHIDRMKAHWEAHGFGLWCVELDGTCIGFTGLSVPNLATSFMPCVEVGWRLSSAHWGRGYAPEAARAALDLGFHAVGLAEIVSFTAERNRSSRRVMEKLGMVEDRSAGFEHPRAPDHLNPHVLYRIGAPPLDDRSPQT